MYKEQRVIKLSERDHVLLRQSMYLGSITPIQHNGFLLKDDKFVYEEYSCVDGLLKIINEIIDNAVDEAIRTNFDFATKIEVSITKTSVEVKDNGRGIPVEKVDGEWMPVLAFTHARAGANFDDTQRVGIGMNGVGAFVCNCFSKVFNVDTRWKEKRMTIECSNNMAEMNVTEYNGNKKNNGTSVYFVPDLEKFGMIEIDDLHSNLIEQRLYHMAVCYPKIKFYFNGKHIKLKNTNEYFKAFSDVYESVESDKWAFAVMPNGADEFRTCTFVNGLDLKQGGTHVDLIAYDIVSRLREKIEKKYKEIKPSDIKSRLLIVAIFRDFPSPLFDSQTKERLTNGTPDIRSYMGEVDYDNIASKLYKKDEIIDPIVEMYKLKEELKKRQLLKKFDDENAKVKVRCEKFLPPIGNNKMLFLCEGDSAVSGIMNAVGRHDIGFFAMRGVPLNAYEVPTTKIVQNNELANVIKILGICLTTPEYNSFTFDNVVIASDADCDGTHITGLLLGFFKKFAPAMVECGRVKKLKTPVIVLKQKDKIKHFFFTINEYNAFSKNNDVSKYTVKYFKGMGTWKKEEFAEIVSMKSLEYFIVPMVDDTTSNEVADDWLSRNKIEKRKEYLGKCQFDIFNI